MPTAEKMVNQENYTTTASSLNTPRSKIKSLFIHL